MWFHRCPDKFLLLWLMGEGACNNIRKSRFMNGDFRFQRVRLTTSTWQTDRMTGKCRWISSYIKKNWTLFCRSYFLLLDLNKYNGLSFDCHHTRITGKENEPEFLNLMEFFVLVVSSIGLLVKIFYPLNFTLLKFFFRKFFIEATFFPPRVKETTRTHKGNFFQVHAKQKISSFELLKNHWNQSINRISKMKIPFLWNRQKWKFESDSKWQSVGEWRLLNGTLDKNQSPGPTFL